MNIPFYSSDVVHGLLKHEMMQAFEKVYDSGKYVLGNEVISFESAFAAFNSVSHCVGTSNGSDALCIALICAGVEPGDEVIVPSNTFIGSALAITRMGGLPVFAEPDRKTYNIDPAGIPSLLSKRTKAIMPVHLYGQACNMESILNLALRYGLRVVEDNAQAHGASWGDKLTGSWGDINATSFYPTKNLGALGDAGAITTNNADLAAKARMLRQYGSSSRDEHEAIGFNMRLDECQAAFLSLKLNHLNTWISNRRQLANRYLEGLQKVGDLILPFIAEKATHTYHLFVIRSTRRKELQAHLLKRGVSTLVHYPKPPHLQKAYENLGYVKGDYPIAEELADTSLSLPLWPGMSEDEVGYVISCVKNYYQ